MRRGEREEFEVESRKFEAGGKVASGKVGKLEGGKVGKSQVASAKWGMALALPGPVQGTLPIGFGGH